MEHYKPRTDSNIDFKPSLYFYVQRERLTAEADRPNRTALSCFNPVTHKKQKSIKQTTRALCSFGKKTT